METMKKKGYTLIEILAVIVILALIALIATPIVMNLIGKAKQKAAIDSAYTYVNSINRNNELAELVSDFSSDNEKYADTFYPNLVAFSNLPIKGTLPTDGEVDINNSKVETANLCINGYWVTYGDNKMNISGSCKADRTELES